MFCLGSIFTISLNNKNEAIRTYLYFFLSFTILILITVIRSFLYQPDLRHIPQRPFAAIQFFALFITLYILAYLMNRILLIPHVKKVNNILFFITILLYIVRLSEKALHIYHIDEIFYIAMFLYYLFVWIKFKNNIVNKKLDKIIKASSIITSLFIPGLVIDELIFTDGVQLIIAPLLYITVSLYSIFSFNILSNSIQTNKYILTKEFTSQFGITERETDVITFLLKGYSYNRIADELVISISTVRTHVMNIYKKTGVNSRYELLNLVK
jgi:DNA-binding CsgD family transcriptional regulator